MAEITRSSKPKTQKQCIIYHLKYIGTITAAEAVSDYNIFRLAEYIRSLRQEIRETPGCNWNIESIDQTKINRFGRTFTYAKYKLNR